MSGHKQCHPFHIVDRSPWPLLSSLNAVGVTVGTVMYMHRYAMGAFIVCSSFLTLTGVVSSWFRDIVREATFLGHHTEKVQRGIKIGVALFIVSEVMLFFSFFWAFFHSSLVPAVQVGCVWPPVGIHPIDAWDFPVGNTMLLLTSGGCITTSHHYLKAGSKRFSRNYLICGILCGLLFTYVQFIEYRDAPFSISDGIYGSTFYMLTGLHGFHVLGGTMFLIVCCNRLMAGHLLKEQHVGYEAAIWYWHFVDIVWLFLWLFVYWWGGA